MKDLKFKSISISENPNTGYIHIVAIDEDGQVWEYSTYNKGWVKMSMKIITE